VRGFRIARSVVDETPTEKVININDDWFHRHAGTGKALHGLFSEFQPFSIGLVESSASGNSIPDAGPIGFAIPGDAHRHAGAGLFQLPLFHSASPDFRNQARGPRYQIGRLGSTRAGDILKVAETRRWADIVEAMRYLKVAL
jgi:hypothetical protein